MAPETSFDRAFDLINWTLKVVGLGDLHLRHEGNDRRRLIYAIGMANLVPLFIGECIFLGVMMGTGNGWDRLLPLADMMPCAIETLYSIVKSLSALRHRRILCALVDDLRAMWPKERVAELEVVESSRYLCFVYTVLTNVLSTVYNFVPLLAMMVIEGDTARRLLPYFIWYPYDYVSGPGWLYVFTYCSQVFAGIFTTFNVSSMDCLFFLLVAHLCMHFKILRKDIMNNLRLDDETSVQDIVTRHNKIIRACKDVEQIFGQSILVNFGASAVTICLCIFSIMICPPMRIMNYVLFLSSAVLQILIMCWYGTFLMDESRAVAQAAYESRWIGKGRKHGRAIILMQIRASKPVAITAMRYAPVSLHTFTAIMSTAWSYFAVLSTMYRRAKHEVN